MTAAGTATPVAPAAGPAATTADAATANAGAAATADAATATANAGAAAGDLSVTRVAAGVWAAARTGRGGARPHPGDAAAAAGMPPWRAREFLDGRGLLRTLLALVCPEAAQAPIRPDGRGRPQLAGLPEIGVSISHDDGRTAACVGVRRVVGIDVQSPPEPLPAALLRRCAHGHLARIAGLPPRRRAVAFAWMWTVQEACVKAEGTGLAGAPWSIDVAPGLLEGGWRDLSWRKLVGLAEAPVSCAWKEWDR